ncbi:MAG: 3-hydroxyacyl-CoA dehydrogenase NAD-binding domain-containing protein [Inhella sp.]|jgi:3-hydroxyacyl-CoA dehydrogenase|uniref:3-hydroxyacyl-CoA dehydrogenase NAD-binding domain-containing protein n=1 Tax=Inhella sp. TaxID=1921806 RepID=UPI0022C89362|nr:3-hydroxyacyl-CoA dehydrogenase NAD-binding domain-containing protein [Inhella sp.]MCZ8235129.1 3-hydroxyacyl-CoA dehydrogenase NAD-binding domain-containing protein [Inhella sp.]
MTTPLLTETLVDGVAVLVMNNPPVNGLSHPLRTALWQAVERLEADPSVQALVITGEGKAFSGGADIREFGTAASFAEPHLPALTQRIEACTKPVVAAVNHLALGGGLELALCCHHRVVADDAQLGLPEVNIGLLPGAGGTQRLPRALGLALALQMITSGAPQRAAKLVAVPGQALIDACVPAAELRERAVAYARSAATCPRLSERSVAPDAAALEAARAQAASLPYPAPLACVEAIAASLDRPFSQGLQAERAGFERLMATEASAALRHAFFAERAVGKVPGIDASTPRRAVAQVAVIGAGTMGSGIATACLMAGLQVDLIEPQADALARGVAALDKHLQAQVDKGRLQAERAAALRANLKPATADDALAQADLVIEAVFEDMALKQTVFRRLDAVCKPGAILASNTSTLDVDQIAAVTQRPADVLGLHFFSPAAVMKLLEVVRGAATAPEVLATALDFGKRIGKTCVVSGVCDGFIGNRMLEPCLQQALFLLDEGCTPQQVDRAIEAWGFAMGPFRMGDLAGNDVSWRVRQQRLKDGKTVWPQPLADALCEAGRFGQKTGGGWYDYAPGSRQGTPSPAVEALVATHRERLGRPARAVPDDEIVDRLLLALGMEGRALLDEGIALRAGDVDVVYLAGYGFPRWRGGPMFSMAQRAPDTLQARLAEWAQAHPSDPGPWRRA